jgi:hypothetical protein
MGGLPFVPVVVPAIAAISLSVFLCTSSTKGAPFIILAWDTSTETSLITAPNAAHAVKNNKHCLGKKNAKTHGSEKGKVDATKKAPTTIFETIQYGVDDDFFGALLLLLSLAMDERPTRTAIAEAAKMTAANVACN